MIPEKPSIEKALAHHGIKGQKWGVRKEHDDSSSSSKSTSTPKPKMNLKDHELTKSWMGVRLPKPNKKEEAVALAENHKKFAAKFEPPEGESSKKGLSSSQKEALKLGVGVVAIGGLIALSHYENVKSLKELKTVAGNPVAENLFKKGVNISKMKSWTGHGYVQPSSFLREEQTFPQGHVFHRIATTAETTFSRTTYSVSNMDDFNRYVVGFRGEKGSADLHHVTFKANKDIKIPTLTTTLETLLESMQKSSDIPESITQEKVLAAYNKMSGGNWLSTQSENFIRALQKKGYDGIVDEMDAGVIGEKPLVLFSDFLHSKVSKPITNSDINQSVKDLKEITNRKS